MPIDRAWNEDRLVQRTSLNFKAIKVGEPRREYTIAPMKQFRIPTPFEVERLKARIAELEGLLGMGGTSDVLI